MEAAAGSVTPSATSTLAMGEEAGTTVLSLPEGASMMIGEDGEQYVTISQDGQTYAIPLSEYQNMQPGGTITIQAQQLNTEDLINNPPQIVVQATNDNLITSSLESQNQSSTESPMAKASPSTNIRLSASTSSTMPPLRPWTGAPMPPEQRRYKPIKVDNWGIFLLSRLQTYFQKKEYTDLTLRFPTKNAQIKVHKLVINACTDFFVKKEEEGLIQDGIYDMPVHFLPELVAPIIRFMYTGRLDLKSHMFTKLRSTAANLGMAVLTKLLDAQLNSPIEFSNNPTKKKKSNDVDPVRQIKRIKKIERKFVRDQKQEKLKPRESLDNDKIVPGKKLPIWKKRETQVSTSEATPQLLGIKHENLSPRAYGKAAVVQSPENGRQLREIQENANFEKIRQSANVKEKDVNETDEAADDRYQEEDDYYDNDAGLDYDEAIEEGDEDEEIVQEETRPSPVFSKISSPAKPILKSTEKETPQPARKSVRFSLRPGGSTTNVQAKPTEIVPDISEEPVEEDIAAEETSSPKKGKTEDAMDKTVDEFSKVAEQEEQELNHDQVTRTRRGRIIHPPNLESPSEMTVKKSPKNIVKKTGISPKADHTNMIAELMRKNPDLFKGNKPVKIKVMSKDASGKNVVKVITVKAQPQSSTAIDLKSTSSSTPSPKTSTPQPAAISTPKTTSVPTTSVVVNNSTEKSFSLRTTPKVKYTGKRGRPPIIKPGENDPHAKERKVIESNLKNSHTKIVVQQPNEESYVAFEHVSEKLVAVVEDTTNANNSNQLDPSSEAEALSHVASGIAASLGLPADSPSNVNTTETPDDTREGDPLSGLEHFEDDFSLVRETRGVKRERSLEQSSSEVSQSEDSSPPKKVSKLALEWAEDEEDKS